MKSSFRYFLPTIAWVILCTILFTLPGRAFPKEDWLDKIYFDKWVHIGLIAIMVWLPSWGFYKHHFKSLSIRTVIVLAILAAGYGLAMEFVQLHWVPNRSFDTGDVIADVAGAVLGASYSWWKYIKK